MKVIQGGFTAPVKIKAEPETVARLRDMADRIESGEITEFVVMYVADNMFNSAKFGAPQEVLTMATLLHRQAVDALITGDGR